MRTYASFMAELLIDNPSKYEKGSRLERLTKLIFTHDPKYSSTYSKVYLWNEWPGRDGKVDTGIDVVAERRDGSGYCAIQCKNFVADKSIEKSDIDSFFSASGKRPFVERIFICTTEKWSHHAEEAFHNQTMPSARLTTKDLAALPFDWDSITLTNKPSILLLPKKELKPHQQTALEAIKSGFKKYRRGQLIMACGTGKTITAVRTAENITRKDALILFCVPSLSLLSQIIREWSSQANQKNQIYPVCSDSKVGKVKDSEDLKAYDLALPSTTDAEKLVELISNKKNSDGRKVIITTYHSLAVIKKAQNLGLPSFSLIICDEAHRTASWNKPGKEIAIASTIHSDAEIRGDRRLYMTATPRLWEVPEQAANSNPVQVFSMDDESIYGPQFYHLGFGEAVDKELLSDYQVLILTIEENILRRSNKAKNDPNTPDLSSNEGAKVIGCWNALANRINSETDLINNGKPLQRCVAFSNSISASKESTQLFEQAAKVLKDVFQQDSVDCEARHVDGTDNAIIRGAKLQWLAETADSGPKTTCKILSNAKCLVEGVDVPSLDAVIFLSPRESQIEIVQAIGRVMRKAEGKTAGYIILPIVVPENVDPEQALNDSKRFKGIWKVIQGLRAHDDRFDALINKIDLNRKVNKKIRILSLGGSDSKKSGLKSGGEERQTNFVFEQIENWQKAIYAKIVQNYGTSDFWRKWASEISEMAERQAKRIDQEVKKKNSDAQKSFNIFLNELKDNINGDVDSSEAITMLSQHLITEPVFNLLFKDSQFNEKNAVAAAINKVLKSIPAIKEKNEADKLDKFYQNVRVRVEEIDSYEGKQKLISRLYQDFFQVAFPAMAKRLGIVYTPVEVVDFILRSADHLTQKEFGTSLRDQGVSIIDPFVGTGTFLARLLQIGILDQKSIEQKYHENLYANEIVMLAYYIAAVNIESAFAEVNGGHYIPFSGITLTDTFSPGRGISSNISVVMRENKERLKKQRQAQIKVIIGNPPYSLRQKSANDSSPNQKHPELDERIRSTYIAKSSAKNTQSLYDPHVKAIRWATDRLPDKGLICFVTNGSFVEKGALDGLRLSIAEDFTNVYVYNLRGNTRNVGEKALKEGGKIFGSGSRASIAMVFLVKDGSSTKPAKIFYHEIEDYLSREQKLKLLQSQESIASLSWKAISPDKKGHWLHQRDDSFDSYINLFDGKNPGVFIIKTLGIVTSRDAWVYGFSRDKVLTQVRKLIDAYNNTINQVNFSTIQGNESLIKWSRGLLKSRENNESLTFDASRVVSVLYRPFVKKYLYSDKKLNEMPSRSPELTQGGKIKSRCILLGDANDQDFPIFATNGMFDFNFFTGGATGFFEEVFSTDSDRNGPLKTRTNISEYELGGEVLTEFSAKAGRKITKGELFNFIYGLLHTTGYKEKFMVNLRRELPRIMWHEDFDQIGEAGNELLGLHISYEEAPIYPLVFTSSDGSNFKKMMSSIHKIKFGKKGSETDRTVLVLNGHNVLSGIPDAAYKYTLNKRSPIEWIMDQYKFSEDPNTKIASDPSDHPAGSTHIAQLLAKAVSVSLKTQEIIRSLSSINI
jgi:predicted helicase